MYFFQNLITINQKVHPSLFYCEIDGIYINVVYVCDKKFDCPSEDDEKNCSYLDEDFFHCFHQQQTISILRVCDYVVDCSDGSDEKFCEHSNCSDNQM